MSSLATHHHHATSDADANGTPRGRGVLLINLGTPDEPTVPAVRRYLTEFLGDPAVIHWPQGLRWLTRPVGRVLAYFRAASSTRLYQSIWTENGAPLHTIADDQVATLQQAMPRGWRVFGAMRYGRPSIPDTLKEIERAGVEELVVIPMYPQFSGTTTGTALREVFEYLQGDGHSIHMTTRASWFDDHGYISAQTQLLDQYARSSGLTPDNCYLLFSTHSLPVSYVKNGDPYPEHVKRTAALVGQRLNWPADRMALAFQSRLGPVKWLKPYTDEVLLDLARQGEKQILVCPISFTTDCLETLEEIDVRYRAMVEREDTELYLCPALNTFGPFINALKQLSLRGPRPMRCAARAVKTTTVKENRTADHNADRDSLVMIGLSLRGRLGQGKGPAIAYADTDMLRSAKRPACDVPPLLRTIVKTSGLAEAFLWNTCHRFELYAVPAEAHADPQELAGKVGELVFDGVVPDGVRLNVLCGADARRHLLRTACGLNSGLPGERDILDQLHAAFRLAEKAGTTGAITRHLVEEAASLDAELRETTTWGRFDPDYTHVALQGVARAGDLDYAPAGIVVIGGSTTSASVLQTLTRRFNVPSRQLTLFYRGHKHGGHLKLLRKALGAGRRVRVQNYTEDCVMQAIADADVVIFGIDREDPVLDGITLRGARDFSARPLTIIDFNMFGSTTGITDLPGVHVFPLQALEKEAQACADAICSDPDFLEAVEQAELHIAGLVTNGRGAASSPEDGRGDEHHQATHENPTRTANVLHRHEAPVALTEGSRQ